MTVGRAERLTSKARAGVGTSGLAPRSARRRILNQVEAVDRESVFMFVGNETVVELASPTGAPSRLADDSAANGELPHACTFTVRDLDAVERHVQRVGVRVTERGGDRLTLEPADCFGAVYSFTTSSVPGDLRPSGLPLNRQV
jgi:hypothetical protein